MKKFLWLSALALTVAGLSQQTAGAWGSFRLSLCIDVNISCSTDCCGWGQDCCSTGCDYGYGDAYGSYGADGYGYTADYGYSASTEQKQTQSTSSDASWYGYPGSQPVQYAAPYYQGTSNWYGW